MAGKKETALTVSASEEQLAELAAMFPQEASFTRIMVPRFGMFSQDVTEKVGKTIKLINEEGEFFIDRETDEEVTRDDGSVKKVWEKEVLDEKNPEVIIVFQRKQLSYYDESEEKYTNSPIFDSNEEQVVLFKDRKEVARGTVAELKALYPTTTKAGKPSSNLKEEKILYVLYKGEMYQMNLKGTSLWSFQAYARKVSCPTVVTKLGSEHCVNGSTEWGKVTFAPVRKINQEEFEMVVEKVKEITEAIKGEKEFYAGTGAEVDPRMAQAEAVLMSDDEDETPETKKLGKKF